MKRKNLVLVVVALALLGCGCGTGTKQAAIDEAMKDPGLRASSFEATARVLDEHPSYVDQFYGVARRHPPTFDRFLADSVQDLSNDDVARTVAALLAEHPDALERTLVDTMDASAQKPESRRAVDRAIAARHAEMADVLTDAPKTTTMTMESSVDDMMKKDQARRALLVALQSRAAEIADILLHDPATLRTVLDAMVKKAGSDKTALKDALKAAGL